MEENKTPDPEQTTPEDTAVDTAADTKVLEKPSTFGSVEPDAPDSEEKSVADAPPTTDNVVEKSTAVEEVSAPAEVDKTIRFIVTEKDQTNLYFTLQCYDRATLKAYEKAEALAYVVAQEGYASWYQAGIEMVSGGIYHQNLATDQAVDPRDIKGESKLILAKDFRLSRLP